MIIPLSQEAIEYERIFSDTISADNHLGNSIENAIKRLKSMERRFEKKMEFKIQYV